MLKKGLMLSIYILLLLVTVSFAWILDLYVPTGNWIELDYQNTENDSDSGVLTIASQDVEMIVDVRLKNGQWKELGRSSDPHVDPLILTDIVPSTTQDFRITFYNKSDKPVSMRVSLSGIECDRAFLDCEAISIGVSDGTSNSFMPLSSGTLLTESDSGLLTYDFVLFEDLTIPAVTYGGSITVNGYIYFDQENMDNTCTDKRFHISSFSASQQ